MKMTKQLIEALREVIPSDAWRKTPKNIDAALAELMEYLNVTEVKGINKKYSEIPTNNSFAGVEQPIKRWELTIVWKDNKVINIISEQEVIPACEFNPVLQSWRITSENEEYVDLVYESNGWKPASRTTMPFSFVY